MISLPEGMVMRVENSNKMSKYLPQCNKATLYNQKSMIESAMSHIKKY